MNLEILVSALVNNIVQFEVTSRLLKTSISHFNLKYFLSLAILTIYVYVSYSLTDNFIRTIVLLYFMILCIYLIFSSKKIEFSKIIIIAFCNWLIFLFSEIIFAILTTIIFNFDYASIKLNFFGNFICNCCISIIYIILTLNPISKKFIMNVIDKYDNLKIKVIMIFISLTVTLLSLIFYLTYFKINFLLTLILDLLVISIYIIVIFKLFDEKYKSDNLKFEYNILLNNLSEYEKMLDYQKTANHENKNQLLVIKGMINKNDLNLEAYINSIIKDDLEDNEVILYKTNKIPAGGMRGLIYYKILVMKEKNINICLDIHNSVRKINVEKLNIDLTRDLCKIIGVVIDNAIEAVESLKEKNIKLTMNYCESKLVISISNNITGLIDLDKMDNPGYTTKLNGHGYGLTLVKQIIQKYDNISNERKIDSDMFTQIIIVEII